MMFRDIDAIRQADFCGFETIKSLRASNLVSVPTSRGVYFVLHSLSSEPVFLEESIGGHFKGRDPTVNIAELESNWVDETPVLYIGKAGGEGKAATLKSRLKQYVAFGDRKPVGHWGGRYIWQVERSDEFKICWKPIPDAEPRDVERELIEQFKRAHSGRRPFANLQG